MQSENSEEKVREEIEGLKSPCVDCGFWKKLLCVYSCKPLMDYQERERKLYGQLPFWDLVQNGDDEYYWRKLNKR